VKTSEVSVLLRMSRQVRLAIVLLGFSVFVPLPILSQTREKIRQRDEYRVRGALERQQNVSSRGERIRATGIFSRTRFESWSLFLVCNPLWLFAERATDLKDLYQSFTHFGDAIGDDNLAVWFSNPKNGGLAAHAEVGENVDLARSSEFCKEWGLKPSRSPYLVVTTTYPGNGVAGGLPISLDSQSVPPQLPKNSAIFELGNMKSSEIHNLLARLTDDLLLHHSINTQDVSPTPAKQSQQGVFVGILESVQRTINSFGCAWRFKVDAGAVQADLQACHKG
jgi:hypothetical protein